LKTLTFDAHPSVWTFLFSETYDISRINVSEMTMIMMPMTMTITIMMVIWQSL